MISGRDIIFISSIEWDFLWQVHQEIAFQFAAAGNRVLYIENIGVRAPALADTGRVANRLKRWAGSVFSRGIREVSPNIFVSSPLVAPPFQTGSSRFVNRHLLLPAVARTARKLNIKDPFLWTYLPTDTAIDLIHLLATPSSLVAYYCGADFSRLTSNPQALRRTEDELLRLADFVFATCSDLFDRCQINTPRVYMVPAVINLDRFQLENPSGCTETSVQNYAKASFNWPRPIIGYVGGLHRFVDYALLTSVARARPNWSFVFVGARTAKVDGFADLPNVHLIGQRPHSELAQYIREFDVCLVPYLKTEGTRTVVPMKINEYLAMGKPIISTDLPTVRDFNDRHHVLTIAPNERDQFLEAIDQALTLTCDTATVHRRREVAKLGDSKALLMFISQLIEARMNERSETGISAVANAAVA